MIQNPNYKGKWKPSLIVNPDYMVSMHVYIYIYIAKVLYYSGILLISFSISPSGYLEARKDR